jgi:hypothetical protein
VDGDSKSEIMINSGDADSRISLPVAIGACLYRCAQQSGKVEVVS